MSSLLEISVSSLQYVKVPVTATVNGAAYNPTSDQVQLAFVTIGDDPAGSDWVTGSWETASGTYYARALVGPGGTVELAKGRYQIYVKITDSPEIPVLESDVLEVF